MINSLERNHPVNNFATAHFARPARGNNHVTGQRGQICLAGCIPSPAHDIGSLYQACRNAAKRGVAVLLAALRGLSWWMGYWRNNA